MKTKEKFGKTGCAFVLAAVLVLTGCDHFFASPDTRHITLSGTLVVTKNSFPLTEADCFITDGSGLSLVYPYAPTVVAYIFSDGPHSYNGKESLGESGAYSGLTWAENGRFNWTMKFPVQNQSADVYFRVYTDFRNACYSFKKEAGSIRVGTKNITGIDLGTIDYEAITLTGNLPVTIDGAPQSVELWLYHDNEELGRMIDTTGADGSWIVEMEPFAVETIINRFTITWHGYSYRFHRIYKIPDITIHNTSQTIVFPGYSGIDFTTRTFSGTIGLTVPEDWPPTSIEIMLIDDYDETQGSGWTAASIQNLPETDGEIWDWTMKYPAFADLPHTYSFAITVQGTPRQIEGRTRWPVWRTRIEKDITETTNLSAIDLGVFTDFSNAVWEELHH